MLARYQLLISSSNSSILVVTVSRYPIPLHRAEFIVYCLIFDTRYDCVKSQSGPDSYKDSTLFGWFTADLFSLIDRTSINNVVAIHQPCAFDNPNIACFMYNIMSQVFSAFPIRLPFDRSDVCRVRYDFGQFLLAVIFAPEALADKAVISLYIFCFSNHEIAPEQGENLTSKLTQLHYLYSMHNIVRYFKTVR